MNIGNVFSNALLGIRRGMAGLNRDASQIASAKAMGGESSSVAPLVDSQVNRLQVEASAKVAKTADEAVGSLFNDKA